MPEDIVSQLDFIFKPKSVAIIGVSSNLTKWGGRILDTLLSSNFHGVIYPINPREKEILGFKVYADVRDIPDSVDMAIFTVPASQMPAVMKSCVEKGVRGGVIISADFAETGEQGRVLQDETARIAREGGLRFVGPNGNGVFCGVSGLNITPIPGQIPGPMGFISQSGTFGDIAGRLSIDRGFGMSKFASMGNQADITASEYLEYLGQDDDTKVIAFYMEGFKDGDRFVEVARRVAKKKPILIMKGGRSAVGARATLSHTGSIAGSDEVFNAICNQAGLIRVYQIKHIFIMAETLASQSLPKGNRIAVIGNGGQGVLTADNLVSLDMDLPEFHKEDQLRLKEIMPSHAPMPKNPVDFAAGAIDSTDELRVIEMLASFDYIDAIITNVPRDKSFKVTLGERKKEGIDTLIAFCEIPRKYGKPIITQRWFASPQSEEFLRDAKIPIFDDPEEVSLAMSALVRYAQIKRRLS